MYVFSEREEEIFVKEYVDELILLFRTDFDFCLHSVCRLLSSLPMVVHPAGRYAQRLAGPNGGNSDIRLVPGVP